MKKFKKILLIMLILSFYNIRKLTIKATDKVSDIRTIKYFVKNVK